MIVTKLGHKGVRLAALSVMGLAVGMMSNQAKAATVHFDVNGTATGYGAVTGGTYSWDDSNWTTANGGTTATVAYPTGANFPEFQTPNVSYTVNVGKDESMAGMYLATTGVTLTINQTPSTSGDLDVASGLQGFLIGTALSPATAVIINAPVTGPGEVDQEEYGSLSLFGNNTYTGGTQTTGGQVLYYNNVNSFGTGSVNFTGGSGQGIVSSGPVGLTIANSLVFAASSTTNFVSGGSLAAPGAIWSGPATLAGNATIEAGTANSYTQFSGAISGTGFGLTVTDVGTVILSGANTYTGTTTVSSYVTGTAPSQVFNGKATLVLGAANTIASSSEVIIAGGILNPGGLNQAMSATTLGVNADAFTTTGTIDFGGLASEIDFANSSSVAWGADLNLANWNPAVDKLRFGTDSTGLISAQLADIEFNGAGLGTAALDANGYVVEVPEPASLSLIGLGALGLLARRRK